MCQTLCGVLGIRHCKKTGPCLGGTCIPGNTDTMMVRDGMTGGNRNGDTVEVGPHLGWGRGGRRIF